MGIDPVHFGLVVIINLMIGLCTPPVGYLIYMLAGIADEKPARVIAESLPFLGALIVILALVTYFPAISLALPRLVYGS
jgi:TRAP-type C4-dicarboxylate transport system permease large subunit